MKKLACFILTIMVILTTTISASASELSIALDPSSTDATPTSYGISLDGLASSNLIQNGSFEQMDKGWEFNSKDYTYGTADAMHKNNPTYNVIEVNGSYTLKNTGYDGMNFIKNEVYDFSFYVRNIDFNGAISVWLDSDKNKNEITQLSTKGISKSSWTKVKTQLTSVENEIGSLAIKFEGTGTIEIDYASLVPQNSYGYKNDAWKNSAISQDIFNAIQSIKPAFMTFSLVDPVWKSTIGAGYERQEAEIGYHEYLQLCSDINSEPIPVINTEKYKADTNKFTNYKQDILDLIEYANASSITSYYGALRAANGATEPFNLKYIQLIGNDSRLDEIKNAINKEYKGVTVLTEKDIAVIKPTENNIGATLENARSSLKSATFVRYNDTFSDLIKCNSNEIAYTTNYFAQMLLANNQGSKIMNSSISLLDANAEVEATIDKAKNTAFISIVNSGSSFSTTLSIEKMNDVASASMQYINDGYLSSYNDIGKQYVAPVEKELDIEDNYINAKIPENSVCVIRITYNNATNDGLFKLPDNISLKAKNYVPPVIIAVIVALAGAIPIGTIIGFALYKKVISKKKVGEKSE